MKLNLADKKSNNFITNENCSFNKYNKTYIFSCDFDSRQYHKKLFKELNIYFPIEIERAVIKRQAEFLAGRYTARQAILQSGLYCSPTPTIPIGKHRSPIWPKGIRGSITHNCFKVICAVTSNKYNHYIGIDLESYLTCGAASRIAPIIHTMKEKSLLLEQGVSDNVATTLIFSAKESLFKALYPFIGDYFGFESVIVSELSLSEGYLHLNLCQTITSKDKLMKTYRCDFSFGKESLQTIISGKL